MGALQKINGQKSGQYQPLSHGTSLAHNPSITLPSISAYKKHAHKFKAGSLKKPSASLISKKVRFHATGERTPCQTTRFTTTARAIPHHYSIHLSVTDANKVNWPLGYVVQHAELQGVQPLVRIDDDAANGDASVVPAHERIRREEIMSRWNVKIGSYLGNLRTGATEGSPEWREYHLVKLPPGYALFEQRRPSEQTQEQHKADIYLCGSDTVLRFRSPREFFEHAHWLMKGKTEPCRCQWCYDGYIRPHQIKHVNFSV